MENIEKKTYDFVSQIHTGHVYIVLQCIVNNTFYIVFSLCD